MKWVVLFHPEFDPEYEALAQEVQDELLAHLKVLEEMSLQLSRPRVDILNGSDHANLKELRFDAGYGVWRFAFAFDPRRCAMFYVVEINREEPKEDSTGISLQADKRFDRHIASIEEEKRAKRKRR